MGKNKSLTQSMAEIGLAINGTLSNPNILTATQMFGYTSARVSNEGLAMYNKVLAEISNFQKEYGEQYSAHNEMTALWDKNREIYMPILRLTRIGLKNQSGALHSLRATGTRKRSITGFIADAEILYNNLLSQSAYLNIMIKFGVTTASINNAKTQLEALKKAHIKYFKEKGEAQDQTVKRDRMYDELYNWYSDFRAVLRIALVDSEQMLEKLGIVVKRK
jgi:hypothetical protein